MKPGVLVSKDKFQVELNLRIVEGYAIRDLYSSTEGPEAFEKLERMYRQWDSYNRTWLENAFTTGADIYIQQYSSAGKGQVDKTKAGALRNGWNPDSIAFRSAFFLQAFTPKIEFLEDILHQIDFIPVLHIAPSLPSETEGHLTHLHPTIQQAAGKLYADGHYRQALLDAFIAVDTAVREKSQLTGSGTRLMEVAFSPGNPVLKIGDSADEQQGFMALFRGAMLAIRNPKAHSLGGTHDAQRALEWLSFASVLLRNLDEAVLAPAAPPAP